MQMLISKPSGAATNQTIVMIWLVAALLLGLTTWQVWRTVEANRRQSMETAKHDLANLTRVSQEHANRTLRSADQVIRFIQARYLELGDKLDLTALTAQGVIDVEIFPQVGIINAKGLYALANRPIKTKIDLSDREHFKVHVDNANQGLFVSKPVLGRSTGRWSIQLTRRISRPNGTFAGVVVVSIDPTYFTKFYGELNLGTQGIVGLYGLDGIARARKVGSKEEFGSNASNAPMFKAIAKGQEIGSYTNQSVVDGVKRIYFYRRIPGYELAVVTGLNTKELQAKTELETDALWKQQGLVSLLVLALAVALTRYLVRLRRAIAARAFAQLQVQDRTEQLNAIFAMSPDGFVSFDRERRVKYMNPAFVQMTGRGDVQLEGLDENDFSAWLASCCIPGSSFSGVQALRREQTSGKSSSPQVLEIASNGKRVLQYELRLSSAQTVSQILYFRDVTHQTEVDEMKSEFLSTAAHELRTPMAGILGFSELLLTQELDASEQKEFLTIILAQSNVMASILNELLDLARIEARRGKDFRYTGIWLQTLITDIVKSLAVRPGREQVELRMPDAPLYLMADEGKLRQVIVNVISNAYKYSPDGGPVVLEVSKQQRPESEEQLCIQIRDHGIGLTPEQVGRVCERFYRADSSGKILGTGLGMSIVKEIIELHHGQIHIDSTYGQGTSVSLMLPMKKTSA